MKSGGPDATEAAGEVARMGQAALIKAGAIVIPVTLPNIAPHSPDARAPVHPSTGLSASSPSDARAGAIVIPVTLPNIAPLSPDARAAVRASAGLSATAPEDASVELLPCLAAPVNPRQWVEWLEKERETAEGQGLDLTKGFVICVERSGFIKQSI
ncbi:hypothetical protein T484DRAFT_1807466 [Baffinella frigidus]|nr:hypothetical protein T484DRAFT_1807466 [Cryptophyta sp. CCMP2293]